MSEQANSVRLIDPALLFRFRLHAWRASIPFSDRLWQLPEEALTPDVGVDVSGQKRFAQVRLACGPDALLFQVNVNGKRQFPWCRESRLEDCDGLHLWIDTRNSADVHRATRYCHRFVCCPMGRGPKGDAPFALWSPIHRARDNSIPPQEKLLATRSKLRPDGYDLNLAIHFSALSGFDKNDFPILGFYYAVVDRELGWQSLGPSPPLPVVEDPSLWGELKIA